jgi:3-methyl-2-oxobutanoate hydroxymethyltransferase
MIGLFDKFVPKFVKQYTNIRKVILEALSEYKQEVVDVQFPAPEHSFKMPDEALEQLKKLIEK